MATKKRKTVFRSLSDDMSFNVLKSIQIITRGQTQKVLLNSRRGTFSFSDLGNDIWEAYVMQPRLGPSKQNPSCDCMTHYVRCHPALILAYERFGRMINGPTTEIRLAYISIPQNRSIQIDLSDGYEQPIVGDGPNHLSIPDNDRKDLLEYFKYVPLLYNEKGQRKV